MSTTAELIRAKLADNAAVTALVGPRIHFNLMPEGEKLPAIVCSLISETPESSLDGTAPLVNAVVQVDCYAERYLKAHELAAAVDAVLGNLKAPALSAWLEVKRDLYDNETSLHRVSMDFSVWH